MRWRVKTIAKPLIHANSSVKMWGGKVEDYLPIHDKLDSSKSVIPDNRHRALTHNSWFLFILEDIFGVYVTNSDGKQVSVRDIGERHILEDFANRFIPSAQDYLQEMEWKDWMNNGLGTPPSNAKIAEKKKEKKIISRGVVMDAAEKKKREEEYIGFLNTFNIRDVVIDRKEDRD